MNPRVLRHRSSLSRSSSSLALTGIVVGLLGFAWTQAALGDDLERLRELEARVGGLLRGVPACVEPAEEETTLRLYAERLGGLEPSEIRRAANSERAVLADGRPSSVELVRWEVSGEAHYGQVRNYLSQLGRLDRLISLEDAAVEASAPGTVRYSLRLLYPCQDADADAPGPLDPDDAAEVGARRVEELELSRQLLTGLHALPKPGALIDALSNLEERLQDQAVAFNILIKAGDRVGFAGVLRGEAARGAIGPALDASGLSVVDTTFRPSMACQTFAIKTVMGVIDAREAASSDDGLFDAGAGESCAPISRQGEAVARRVETTGTTAADAGGLTLHLRDVEIGDLFSVLFHLTGIPGLGFVVGPEVHGRLSVDAEDVTLDELLAALDTAGIALGPGPLHRVSTSSPDPSSPAIPAADRYSEPALTVSFQDQELASILCLFGAVGERRVAVPRDLEGRMSVYVGLFPRDQVLEAILDASGLETVTEDDTLFVAPAASMPLRHDPGAFVTCGGTDPSPLPPAPRLARILDDNPAFAAADLHLAGVARADGGWKAYVYAVGRRLRPLETGQTFFDGWVVAVDESGIEIETEAGGAMSIPLAP